MTAILPAFVHLLLGQSTAPGEIPAIDPSHVVGWRATLVARVLTVFDTGSYRAEGSFLAHGYAHLPVPLAEGPAVYLRLATQCGTVPWPVPATSVVLTIAGSLKLEMYQEVAGSPAQQPSYTRVFRPEEAFAVHAGTLCATRSSVDALQLLAVAPPADPEGSALTRDEYTKVTRRARGILDGVSLAAAGGRP